VKIGGAGTFSDPPTFRRRRPSFDFDHRTTGTFTPRTASGGGPFVQVTRQTFKQARRGRDEEASHHPRPLMQARQ
jgi:hypothetical protein